MRKTLFEMMQEKMDEEDQQSIVPNTVPDNPETNGTITIDQSFYNRVTSMTSVGNKELKIAIESIIHGTPVHPDLIKSIGLKNKGVAAKKANEDQLREYAKKLETIIKSIEKELNKDEYRDI